MDKIFIGRLTFYPIVGLTIFVGLTINLCHAQVKESEELYAQKKWFTSHPSPVVDLEGEIKKIENPLGPNSRIFYYVFKNEQTTLPIYDPENLIRIEFTMVRKLKISGKIVDLENEGFSKEIWIGYIKE